MNQCCTAATSTQDLAQLFAFGLVISAGHCLGMCAPLVSALSLAEPKHGQSRPSFARAVSIYHAGRIASYAAIGFAIGSIGDLVPERASAVSWQASLSFLAAAALVWVGLGLLDVFPIASFACAGRVSTWLMRRAGIANESLRRFTLGVANGLLPCGPVYTVALAALAAGSAPRGAAAMVAFGAGTLPLFAALAFGLRWIGDRARVSLHKFGGAFAIAMACQLMLRGAAALDWMPHFAVREVVLW